MEKTQCKINKAQDFIAHSIIIVRTQYHFILNLALMFCAVFFMCFASMHTIRYLNVTE